MRVLCVGDVFGKAGRQAIDRLLPSLIERHAIELVVVNGENAAGGVGLTLETARELLAQPIDVLTSGNHIWKHKELLPLLEKEPRLLRPFNYPPGTPGRGIGIFETASGVQVGIVDLEGRVFMQPLVSPFDAADQAVSELGQQVRIILVEIHAEATSEKRALGWHLAGRASVVYGTHTHVPTADEEVLEGGTGYITDLGMTGPYDSVIGMRKHEVLQRFRSQRPAPFVAASDDVRLCGAIFDIDPVSGRTTAVQRVCERLMNTDHPGRAKS